MTIALLLGLEFGQKSIENLLVLSIVLTDALRSFSVIKFYLVNAIDQIQRCSQIMNQSVTILDENCGLGPVSDGGISPRAPQAMARSCGL